MRQSWMLLDASECEALPWPLGDRPFASLSLTDLADLASEPVAMTVYAPSDGMTEASTVPADLPRGMPSAPTHVRCFHDAEALYVVVEALPPPTSIPGLEGRPDDFMLMIGLDPADRGLYFGVSLHADREPEAICWAQAWNRDPVATTAAPCDVPPWDRWRSEPFAALDGYTVRHHAPEGLAGRQLLAWRIERDRVAAGLRPDPRLGDALRLSVGRRCARVAELQAWGSPLIWHPRPEAFGTVRLVAAPSPLPRLPTLHSVGLEHDPAAADGVVTVVAHWRGLPPAERRQAELRAAIDPGYANYAARITLAMNDVEHTLDLAACVRTALPVQAGWNRLEILSPFAPPTVLQVPWQSRVRLRPARASTAHSLPTLDTLQEQFAAWHTRQEANYAGPGLWVSGGKATPGHRYGHDHHGAFPMEAYALACLYLDRADVYAQRVRATCERIVADIRQPGDWIPCYHFGQDPAPFDGGAFGHGSAGEALVLGYRILEDERYLEAARRTATAYARHYPLEYNCNYAAFVAWHLAALHELDPRPAYLATAAHYLRHFATRPVGPGGAPGGHNYYSAYGNITLKGMARLLHQLPAADPYHAELRAATIAYANALLQRQQPDGLFAGRNRRYLGYQHLLPGLFEVLRALPEERETLEPALLAMYHHPQGHADGLTIALMARHVAG